MHGERGRRRRRRVEAVRILRDRLFRTLRRGRRLPRVHVDVFDTFSLRWSLSRITVAGALLHDTIGGHDHDPVTVYEGGKMVKTYTTREYRDLLLYLHDH